MADNLLSILHIEKLGHSIEEIRLRALSSVISKYNLNLVDRNNLENTKVLLEKLVGWFDFERCPEEGKVLSLLLKVVRYENADLILKEIDRKNLIRQVARIEKKLGCQYQPIIQDIIKYISSAEDDSDDHYTQLNCAFIDKSKNLVNGKSSDIYDFQNYYAVSSRDSKSTEDNLRVCQVQNNQQNCIFKVEFFPWQHLTPGDKQVLSSVYDGLRYIDNRNSVLKACQFFNEVLLRDFPTEVLIQRPSIIKTFLQLVEHAGEDIRIPVIKSLTKTVESLKKSLKAVLNPSLFNTKREYYTTSVFPTSPEDTPENFHLNLASFDEDLQFDDNDYIDPNLRKYQLSVPQFCFDIIFQILPHLGRKCSQEEVNCLLNLTYETINCLIFNIKSEIWSERELRNKFYKLFAKLCEVLKFQKGRDTIAYMILLHVTVKILNYLKPPSGVELSEILIAGLQSELGSCISNAGIVLFFPHLHSEILKWVEKLLGQKEKDAIRDYKELLTVEESMKFSVKFLRSYGTVKKRMDALECMKASLPSLDFHQNYQLIQQFVNSCLLKWRKSQLSEEELKCRDKILIRLLAHCNDFIKNCTYKEIHNLAMKLLTGEEAKSPRFDFPGDKLDFLFRTDILTEIICHGLNSPLETVRKYSSEIISNLLKSKYVMSEIRWSDFISALIPCLSLLQCYADKSTVLGRCVVKMFDPDVARCNVLPPLEVLKGNMRFLFSKNNLTRDEALSRLFWLLSKEDQDSKKLPRMSVLTGLNLSGVCSSVKPKEFTKIRQSFYSPARLGDVLEMLNSDHVEPNLRRSALSQISVMMEDVHLHQTFLEQNGLEKILQILDNCLVEREYRNYPDSVKPIIDILRALAYHNVSIRQELTCQIDVFYNILRGLFLFSSDDALRQNAVELICLLLYSDCILRVPSDLSIKCTVSFPDLVVNRMCLPFLTHIHWRNSRHLVPSIKKTLMSKPNCCKLIRIQWAIHWVGSLFEIMATQPSDLPDKTFSPGIPEDMKVSVDDVECLKSCAFGLSVKQILYNIQNATTHETVFSSLDKLHSYFLLYNIDKATSGRITNDLGSDTTLSHMLWESTLERFMTAQPSCNEDEFLLLKVIRLVQVLLRSFNSGRLIDWVGKLLTDENQPLIKQLRNIGNENFGLVGKELRLAIIELTQQIVTLKTKLDRNKWFVYLELISKHLQLDKKNEFYNVAYVDWFLSLLADLTGKWGWNFTSKINFLEKLIVRIVEIVIAFHCTKDSAISFMGGNIVRNSLLALNSITSSAQEFVKGWEKVLFQALSKVIGQEREVNYCWMLSLWFTRDTLTRSAAYSLFVGFSATSLSCDLLIDQLKIQFEHVWSQTFKTLFDENECSFVREKAALLLANLTSQGTKTSCGVFCLHKPVSGQRHLLQDHTGNVQTLFCRLEMCDLPATLTDKAGFLNHLENINFYLEVNKIISNYDCTPRMKELWLHETVNCFSGHVVTTPSFVRSICMLLKAVMALNPKEVSARFLESEIVASLVNVLGEIPESANLCGIHEKCTDVMQMYATVSQLLTRMVMYHGCVHSYLLQSQQCIGYFFSMINYQLFCEHSYTVNNIRVELWAEIFDLFSALLADNESCDKEANKSTSSAFIHINKCITDNGVDHFISSLYLALISDDNNIRTAVFKFLINLLRHELYTPKHISISDMFERKVSNQAIKLAGTHSWKALKISENLTGSFGIRAADILLQVFLLSTSCNVHSSRVTVADCLATLLAVCQPAQNFCVEKGLPDSLISILKQICVKLSLENVENFKKLSVKKRINPLLSDAESSFRLLSNLMYGNGKAKTVVADCSLSTVVFNLWPWCSSRQSLFITTLKMLCTFTHSCDHACKTLTLSGSLSKLGLKKSPGSATLMNSIMNQVTVEMDLISDSHDSQVLRLCLQLLTNCCRITECRTVISKGHFMQSFTKLNPSRKKRLYSDAVEESWFKFFVALSSHPDGQLTIAKNQDLLDVFMKKCTSTKSSYRIVALSILRNICFHQSNRLRMLSYDSFLCLLLDSLDSTIGEEIHVVAVMLWVLTCNCQKAKLIVRNSGFEAKLVATKRRFVMNEDLETADLIDIVLGILRNR